MIFLYDGSFEGFLSVIFECYAQKVTPQLICSTDKFQEILFAEKRFIATNADNTNRVWKGWQQKMSRELNQLPFLAFLSGEQGIEMSLYQFARLSFATSIPLERNYSDPDILAIRKASRRVTQEAMRMLQFVRFQKTKDDIYFSGISPRYDVLPMILKHFKDRFADQHWLVYDIKRDYGFYYNRKTVEQVSLGEKTFNTQNGKVPIDLLQEEETNYQHLWSDYCQNITIRQRLNIKLQRQHMPKRYWKFLPEKVVVK